VIANHGQLYVFGDFAPVPPSIEYYVSYVPRKDAPLGSYQPRVTAEVSQFSNADWARYKVKYPSGLTDLRSLLTITKFGNKIVMNTMMRYPNGDGELDFLWPCGDVVVTLRYQIRDVNEEFLKRYLDRYPSSL
jgi:hypothetical protein